MHLLERTAPPPHEAAVAPGRQLAPDLGQAIFDLIECGLIVCDAQRQIVQTNRAARRELERGDLLCVRGATLQCADPSMTGLCAAVAAAAVQHRVQLVRVGRDEHRMVAVMPLNGVDGAAPLVLVMIGRGQVCTPLGLEMLGISHHLTIAEQCVLRALVVNQSAREIAVQRKVSLSTVRTQIQSIRDKLRVRNIDHLLLLAAQVPPIGACH